MPLSPTANASPVRPRVPLAPVLSATSLRAGAAPPQPGVLDASHACFVTSGRIAIALALRQMGIDAGDVVLVPAYHSLSMIPPVQACGAVARFYRVGADAAVDLDDLAARIDGTVKVVMVTHYFGFPQAMAPIRALCQRHGVLLLEDCAHCFFGSHDGRPVGAWGDYAIASSMKFFPNYEGGMLISAQHRLDGVPLRSAGAGFEIKVALTTLENSFSYGRLPLLHALLRLPLALKSALWRRLKARAARRSTGAAPAELAPASSDSSYRFDPAWLDKRSSWCSRRVLAWADHGRIVARRRANYQRLDAALGALPGVRALHRQLPADACPWMYPLVFEQPQAAFAQLVARAVPVTRFAEHLWPGVDASVCANSARLSRHVLAFPCHQELRESELAWIIEQVRQIACGEQP